MSGFEFGCAQAVAVTSKTSLYARSGRRCFSRVARWACCLVAGSTVFVAGCATTSEARINATEPAPSANTPTFVPPRATETTAVGTPPEVNPLQTTSAEATRAAEPSAETPTSAPDTQTQWLQFTPQIRIDRARGIIACDIVSVLDVGFLEQYVCAVGTREHESLFVFEGKASELHAAMLLAGWTPGKPGNWREVPPQPTDAAAQNQRFIAVPPSGEALTITVELPDGSTHPLTYFVRASPLGRMTTEEPNGDRAKSPTPPSRFVFAGSRFRTDQRTGFERYIADGSGSIVGLVTFGDETIAAVDVIPDQVAAADPVWEVFTDRMPKPGTRLTLRIERPRPRRRLIAKSLRHPSSARSGAVRGTRAVGHSDPHPDERKKARPRQSLRPSPSGGKGGTARTAQGRYLPTLCRVLTTSTESKGFLAKSPSKVNSGCQFIRVAGPEASILRWSASLQVSRLKLFRAIVEACRRVGPASMTEEDLPCTC